MIDDLVDFARGHFRMEVVNQPGDASLGAHYRQAAKSLARQGKTKEADALLSEVHVAAGRPPIGGEFAWSVFTELNATRSAGFTPNPISFTEIWAWQQLSSMVLQPWEVVAIKKLDIAFLEESNARSSRTQPRRQQQTGERRNPRPE